MNIPDNMIFKRMPSAEQAKTGARDDAPADGEDGFIEILEDLPLKVEAGDAGRDDPHAARLKTGKVRLILAADHRERHTGEDDPADANADAGPPSAGTHAGAPSAGAQAGVPHAGAEAGQPPAAAAVLQMLSSASGFALHRALRPTAAAPSGDREIDPRVAAQAQAAPVPPEADADGGDALTALSRMRFSVMGGETHFAPVTAHAASPGAAQTGRKIATQSAGEGQAPSLGAPSDPGSIDDASLLLSRRRPADAQPASQQEDAPPRLHATAAPRPPQPETRAINLQPEAGANLQSGKAAEAAADPAPSAPDGLPASQLGRIASAIADDGLDLASSQPASAGQTPGAATSAQATAGPVRTLNLQLDPAGLGTVRIDLRLSHGELSVTLRASRDDTAKMLERDKHTLIDMLRASGHDADRLAIHTAHADAGTMQQDSQQSTGRGGAQAWAGGQGAAGQGTGSGAEQGRPSPQQQQSPEWGRRQLQQGAEGNAQSSGEGGRGRDLYV